MAEGAVQAQATILHRSCVNGVRKFHGLSRPRSEQRNPEPGLEDEIGHSSHSNKAAQPKEGRRYDDEGWYSTHYGWLNTPLTSIRSPIPPITPGEERPKRYL